MTQVGNKIRATLEEAAGRKDLTQNARTGFLAEPPIRQGIRLTHAWRGEEQSLSQDSNQFPGWHLPWDLTITISVIEGTSKGLVYEMRQHCVTLGRTGGGADFQFNEPEASAIQCIVATRQNGVCLYDAVSVHGTYVNDRRIAAAELTHMSTFRVGSSLLLVQIHPNQAADTC